MSKHVLRRALSLLRHFWPQKCPNNDYFVFFCCFFASFYTELNFVIIIAQPIYMWYICYYIPLERYSQALSNESVPTVRGYDYKFLYLNYCYGTNRAVIWTLYLLKLCLTIPSARRGPIIHTLPLNNDSLIGNGQDIWIKVTFTRIDIDFVCVGIELQQESHLKEGNPSFPMIYNSPYIIKAATKIWSKEN